MMEAKNRGAADGDSWEARLTRTDRTSPCVSVSKFLSRLLDVNEFQDISVTRDLNSDHKAGRDNFSGTQKRTN